MKKIYNPRISDLEKLFEQEDILITLGDSNPTIVIGSPHQTPLGHKYICTPRRTGDTSSGLLALNIYLRLKELNIKTKLVIANRAKGADPNKDINSDYSKEIINSKAEILFEVHGQSARNKTPLEFSCGKNDITKLTKFGLFFYEELRQLQKQGLINSLYRFIVQESKDINRGYIFTQTNELKSGELILPALRSILIDKVEDYNMRAFHLESMPQFRFKSKRTRDLLSIAISKSLYKLLIDKDYKDD